MVDFLKKVCEIGFIILILVSIGLNIYFLTRGSKMEERVNIITTEKIDTIRDTIPQIKKEKVISYIIDTIPFITVNHDTIMIERQLPITQKEYSDDSTYTAWVSGYRQNLDSIRTYRKTVTIEKTITQQKKETFWSRWNIGIGVYGGYGIFNKKPDVFVGGGLQYKIK